MGSGHQHIQQDFLASLKANFPFTTTSYEEVREDLLHGILSNYYSIDSHYHLNVELRTLFSDLFQIDKEKDFMKALAFVEKGRKSMDVEWWWGALLKVLFTKFSVFSKEIDNHIVSLAKELTGLTLSKEAWKHLPAFSDYQGNSILDYDVKQEYKLDGIIECCGMCGTEHFGGKAHYYHESFMCEECYLYYQKELKSQGNLSLEELKQLLMNCAEYNCLIDSYSSDDPDFYTNNNISLVPLPIHPDEYPDGYRTVQYNGHQFKYSSYRSETDIHTIYGHTLFLVIPARGSVLRLTWPTYHPSK